MITEAHAEIFDFAQRAQTLALVLLEPDPVQRLSGVWDVLSEVPRCGREDDRVVLAEILRRLAGAFVRAERPRELPPEARTRRVRVSDVHCSRALECVRREFANPALDLRAAATRCRLSAPYLSHLISVSTRHGFHTHLSGVRFSTPSTCLPRPRYQFKRRQTSPVSKARQRSTTNSRSVST